MSEEEKASTKSGPVWVSPPDAADSVGVSPQTVRGWVEQGLIVSRRGKGPTGFENFVRLDEIKNKLKELPLTESAPSVESSEIAPVFRALPDLIEELTKATERAARAEMKVEFLNEKVADLKEQLKSGSPATAPPSVKETPTPQPGTQVTEPADEPSVSAEAADLEAEAQPAVGSETTPDIWADDKPADEAAAPTAEGEFPDDLWNKDERGGGSKQRGDGPPPDLWSPEFNRRGSAAKRMRAHAETPEPAVEVPKRRFGLFRRKKKTAPKAKA